jgi:hypothetical protein
MVTCGKVSVLICQIEIGIVIDRFDPDPDPNFDFDFDDDVISSMPPYTMFFEPETALSSAA